MTPAGILELIDGYLDGTADAHGVAQLKAWLEQDKANIRLFAREVFLHQQLRETLLAENTARCLTSTSPVEADNLNDETNIINRIVSDSKATKRPIVFPHDSGWGFGGTLTHLPLILLVMAFASGLAFVAFQLGWKNGVSSFHLAERANLNSESAPYVAKLVKLTNCQWDSTRTTADLSRGSQLAPGQSLHLLEGVAEINSTARSGMIDKFRLEGPAGLMMGSQGVSSLLYGRLSATSTIDHDPFALDTPLGRVILTEDACIGVVANTNEVELHVFFGSAVFEPLVHLQQDDANERYSVASGSALRVTSSSEAGLVVENGVAKEDGFITQASLNASRLNISSNYVAAIKAAKPIAYWRFDRVRDGLVLNEMSNQFACRIEGPVRWRTYPAGNRSAEFGFADQPGFLLSDDAIGDALRDEFTIEFWLKPSYFQRASVFSLVECAEANVDVPQQCALFELFGQAADPGPVMRSRMRFLHRTPPGRNVNAGVSCFSEEQYAPRKWQHVAAVKNLDSIKLYLDGKLVAEANDSSETPAGLRILMGQLFSFTSGPNAGIRPFVGELAEVAIYGKALESEDLLDHIKLRRRTGGT